MPVPGTTAQFGDTPRAREQLGLGPLATMSVLPWAAASDSTQQSIAVGDFTPQQVTFNTSEGSSDTIFSANAFNVKQAGAYLLTFSAVINLSSGGGKNHHIWLRKNGVNVDRTNTHTVIANSNDDRVITVTILGIYAIGDILTLWQSGDSVALSLNPTAAVAGAKGYPASPSIIATFNYVSP